MAFDATADGHMTHLLARIEDEGGARPGASRRRQPAASSPNSATPIRAAEPPGGQGRSSDDYASTASISGVTAASVSGMPRSRARLSARASSRRIRPAMASLFNGGSATTPPPPHRACQHYPQLPAGHGRALG